MKRLTILFMIVTTIATIAKYSVIPVIATYDTINTSVWCIDRHNNGYLLDNVTSGKGYTIIIDRHNVFNSEDNEIIYISL